ncbi:MAG: PH domain-containing protein [Marinifilaceae bacterium]|jgi:membrane protein YdbS with pleckstrin-like domain|nr:PH domain-containing protein [Marinifilaceae bacterium]
MSEFTNENIDINALCGFENLDFKPINRRYLNVRRLKFIIFFVIILIAMNIIALTAIDFPYVYSLIPIVFVFLIFISIILILPKAHKKRAFALRENDITYKSGLIWHSIITIPLNRVQHVAVTEGPVTRMYKLKNLNLYTSGESSSDLVIKGLTKEQAFKIKDFINSRLEKYENQ